MLSVYQLKPRFQALLRPWVKKLYQHSITANQVTLLACLGSLIVAIIVVWLLPNLLILWLIPLWMFIRMALNAIDGMLAREFKQQSNLGAYLNELCDVISDSALFCILIYLPDINLMLVVILIVFSLLSEYAGVLGPFIGVSRRYDGPMGKSDRAVILGVVSTGLALGWLPTIWLNSMLIVVIILLGVTIINRVRCALKEYNKQGMDE